MTFNCLGGVYKWIEEPVPQQSAPLKFSDLVNDVTVGSLAANWNYKLYHTGKEWKPAINTINVLGGWHLEIKAALLDLYLGKIHAVEKIQNKGQLLAAYVLGRNKKIIVKDNLLHGYVLGKKGACSGTLNLTSEFSSHLVVSGVTIFMKAVLGDRPEKIAKSGLSLETLHLCPIKLCCLYYLHHYYHGSLYHPWWNWYCFSNKTLIQTRRVTSSSM